MTLSFDDVLFPNGTKGRYIRITAGTALGGAAVPDSNLRGLAYRGLVRQYRYPVGKFTLEVPRGGSEDLSLAEAARELIEETGLEPANHFPDVRHLAAWVFETEVARQVRSFAAEVGWAEGLVRLMLYMRNNRSSTLRVLDGLGQPALERFLFRQMRPVTEAVMDEDGGGPARPKDRVLVVDFYTSAVLAVVLRWVTNGMVEHPYSVVGDLEIMLHGAVRESVRRLDARDVPQDVNCPR